MLRARVPAPRSNANELVANTKPAAITDNERTRSRTAVTANGNELGRNIENEGANRLQ